MLSKSQEAIKEANKNKVVGRTLNRKKRIEGYREIQRLKRIHEELRQERLAIYEKFYFMRETQIPLIFGLEEEVLK